MNDRAAQLALLVAINAAWGCSPQPKPAVDAGPPGPTTTFSQASDAALQAMTESFYHQGNWELCAPTPCFVSDDDFDWGADSLTDALYLRWLANPEASVVTMLKALDSNGPTYGTCTPGDCPSWSDVPMWDSIAASREFQATGDAEALVRSKQAFTYVDTATQFLLGACPTIDFQQPDGGGNQLKTLETDSNYIKAALLLNQLDPDGGYLDKAVSKYAAVRQTFLDPEVALYTVFIIDDGQTCTPVPHQFYASVNGNMIWSGVSLASATGDSTYLNDAVATGQAVQQYLSDAAGVYANLQADDDVAEPMIEGMYQLATVGQQGFAHDWLLSNARAMASSLNSFGVYGRFFDGPPPPGMVTEWQAAGGLALAFVAGGLDPTGVASSGPSDWAGATQVTDDLPNLPSSIQFTGKAIALFGTIGEVCCEPGHARVFIDGTETFDQTGIWQNESNVFQSVPNSILFAWRWPTSGPHTLEFQPGITDPKQGGGFLHIQSYAYVP